MFFFPKSHKIIGGLANKLQGTLGKVVGAIKQKLPLGMKILKTGRTIADAVGEHISNPETKQKYNDTVNKIENGANEALRRADQVGQHLSKIQGSLASVGA